MKVAEIREFSTEELKSTYLRLQEDSYKLRVKKATNQLENTNEISRIRKDVAKVLTVMRARELGRETSKKETAKVK